MKGAARKITNSAQLIDFFVHDILDYALLKGKKQNFMPDIQIFDIEEAVNQVVEVLQDKANMKAIKIIREYQGFKQH